MIELQEITKSYRLKGVQIHVLRGITFDISRKEFVAIMGPSGSGKSTLLAILGCLSRPSSGLYCLEREDVSKLTDNQLAMTRNRKIGFVFQEFNLIPRISALENVCLPLFYTGLSPKRQKELACEVLEAVGLTDRMRHNPDQLSGGEQQRVAIARALVTNPSIIFADEPTGNLDSRSSGEIMSLFQELNLKGNTIVVITHDENIAQHTKRIIHIEDGQIISDELVESPRITQGWRIPTPDLEKKTKEDLNKEIRLSCVRALPKIASQEIIDALEIMLKDKSEEVRIETVGALGDLGGQRAFELLKGSFNDSSWAMRVNIVASLGKIGEPSTSALLIQALNDENSWVRFSAIVAINKLGLVYKDAFESLLHILKDPDERVRATVLRTLGRFGSPDMIEHPISMLKDESARVRANAVRAIAELFSGDSEKLVDDYLADMLKDGDARVRANAIEVISFLISRNRNRLVELISPLLQDRNNRVKANASIVVWAYETDKVKLVLQKMVEDTNRLQRASAAYALGIIAETESTSLLIRLLNDPDYNVRANAIKSLNRFKDPQIRKNIIDLYNQLLK